MISLSFPFTEENIRALKVGGEVLIFGVGFTGRDVAARPPGEKVHQTRSIA
jgi:tartrate dehydratase beta subunit/fumarate hydratase class I family protein